jgi:periplasmic divalent cation tolerance protein
MCDEDEVLLIIKSRTALLNKIADTIKEIHTYDVPEIVQIPITDGLPEYLQWIGKCTKESVDYE